jgi:tetratricopeptide (TPR) repeat protein
MGCGYGGCLSYGAYYGQPNVQLTPPADAPPPVVLSPANGQPLDFSLQGENEFRAGNYDQALSSWRHALLDDPKNVGLVVMTSQALYAIGKYDEAAGTLQYALRQMPEEKWGFVVENFQELYSGNGDYTKQLRALEAASENPASATAAVRFLLGYQYGYLGYPKHAVAEFDAALKEVPQDEVARRLRDLMAAKLAPTKTTDAKVPPVVDGK